MTQHQQRNRESLKGFAMKNKCEMGPIRVVAAQNGSLSGFHVLCSCGWHASTSLSAHFLHGDINDHLRYMENKREITVESHGREL